MLLSAATARSVADGTVTHVFRRWDVIRIAPGQEFRSSAGVIRVTSVDEVDPARLTNADVVGSDATSVEDVRSGIARREGRHVVRVGLQWVRDDPRVSLRASDALGPTEIAAIRSSLQRLDARSAGGPWTDDVLRVIAQHPGRSAALLAQDLRRDRLALKRDVRKLKELGLTESLDVGYQLSPRGLSFMRQEELPGS